MMRWSISALLLAGAALLMLLAGTSAETCIYCAAGSTRRASCYVNESPFDCQYGWAHTYLGWAVRGAEGAERGRRRRMRMPPIATGPG